MHTLFSGTRKWGVNTYLVICVTQKKENIKKSHDHVSSKRYIHCGGNAIGKRNVICLHFVTVLVTILAYMQAR